MGSFFKGFLRLKLEINGKQMLVIPPRLRFKYFSIVLQISKKGCTYTEYFVCFLKLILKSKKLPPSILSVTFNICTFIDIFHEEKGFFTFS